MAGKQAKILNDSQLAQLCVPKIRFCNIGGEGHRELGVT
jgi:hypothetical protein